MTIDPIREKLEIIDFEKWTESEKERSLKDRGFVEIRVDEKS